MMYRLDAEQARAAADIAKQARTGQLLPIAAKSLLVALGIDGASAHAMIKEALALKSAKQSEDES